MVPLKQINHQNQVARYTHLHAGYSENERLMSLVVAYCWFGEDTETTPH